MASLTALSLLALALPAAAQADDQWTGAATSPNWSQPTNWLSGVAPSGAVGTLTFPDLPGCVAPSACFVSTNNLPGISATGLVFSNATGAYRILGNGLAVGSGGITATSGGNTGTTINTPLSLTLPQAWMIASATNGYNSLSLAPPATVGGLGALGVVFPPATHNGDLFVDSEMEVGPVTVTGLGGLHIGGPTTPGSVNGTNGNPVTIGNRATLVANPGAKTGALTIGSGAALQLGTGLTGMLTTTLDVNGTVSLDPNSSTTTNINDNGPARGTDYSQLSASGDVAVAGTLKVSQGTSGGACVALNRGDIATLFTTTGTLSGTFVNAANGQVIPMISSCQATVPSVQIAYTSNSVTATVVTGSTPTATTLATPSPSPASTNQTVTLAATVSTLTNSTIVPSGTVSFSNHGNPIPGCTSRAVSGSASSGTATCTSSFAASTSPEALTATFTGAPASAQASSSSSVQDLTVNMDPTATSVAASNTSPGAGGNVTYTATVTPGHGGPSEPSGTVQFLDAGKAIAGCAGKTLTAGSSSSTATCTVSYPSAGSHSITAGYRGDGNFGGSSSSPLTVNVGPAPGGSPISATTSPATHVGTRQATLNGSVTTGGATVTWQFQYGRSISYNKGTPLQTIAAGQNGPVSVSWSVKRLSPNVRYHFRLVVSTQSAATAAVQIVDGQNLTFTTRATGKFRLAARRLAVIGHTILVPEKCLSVLRCSGRFSITTTAHMGKKKKLGTVLCTTRSFGIRAHRKATIKARIRSACLALLKSNPHHRIAAKYTSRPRTGQLGLIKKITLALA